MILALLNYLHRKGWFRTLSLICAAGYFLKGKGIVPVRYHAEFRAYEFRVRGVSYLSAGPGWAYGFNYLKEMLRGTFCYFYFPKAGDLVIDIGAGVGEEMTAFAAAVGPEGKVYALEANPITCSALIYLRSKNNWKWVSAYNLAIFSREGVVQIEDDPDNYLVNTINKAGPATLSVPALSLDAFVARHNIRRIDFLKSNIEGAEQFLLEGMKESVHLIQNLCISCHDFRHVCYNHGEFYMTKAKVSAFLESHGFELMVRTTGNRSIDDYIYARKRNA